MYYNYLNRDQPYLRSYRTHNLWFDQYQKKVRTPRITAFHLGIFKRLGKTYSGVSRCILISYIIIRFRQELWPGCGVLLSWLVENS